MYPAGPSLPQQICLLLLIDQSSSMATFLRGTDASKASQVSLTVNWLLGSAARLCGQGIDRGQDAVEIGVLGYRGTVRSVLHGSTDRRPLVPVSQLAVSPLRMENVSRAVPDGLGGTLDVVSQIPVWIEPVADGPSCLAAAMEEAERVVWDWCDRHPRGCQPIVINVTTGEDPGDDPRPAAARLRSTRTASGSTLLFNVHLASGGTPVTLPDNAAELPDRFASVLFCMSSALPEPMTGRAFELGYATSRDSLGFLYNANATAMMDFLDIGTQLVTHTTGVSAFCQ